ncbi:hypothetical protein A2U01_0070302, partial [Trifolium medium]|nr:hypothetical protein [Trifolium medium]
MVFNKTDDTRVLSEVHLLTTFKLDEDEEWKSATC